ncbi:hypothetical protein [Paraburkholderia tropica]|uniref:hypothetical protein n=1 Tax=Paraburkholderia tropica TaxID=92647 RepID=UPI0031016CA6
MIDVHALQGALAVDQVIDRIKRFILPRDYRQQTTSSWVMLRRARHVNQHISRLVDFMGGGEPHVAIITPPFALP